MADDDTPERPKPRDKTISARIPADVYDKARERAKKEQRPLSAIIRAWLTLFSEDEAPRCQSYRPRQPAPKNAGANPEKRRSDWSWWR